MLTVAKAQMPLPGSLSGLGPVELKPGEQSIEPGMWAALSAGKGTGGRTPGAPATDQLDHFE